MARRAVLLVNLGSPDSTSIPDVRNYLREFLGDERVLDISAPLRWLLLEGIILRTRPRKTAKAYKKIWTEQGSPLVVTTKRLQHALKTLLYTRVEIAMRYGKPSIADALKKLNDEGFREILLIPQYPHYAMSSWETVVVKVHEEAKVLAPDMHIKTMQPFFQDEDYITALTESALPYLKTDYDHLLFSYHGIPQRHLMKADASRGHCLKVDDCCTLCSPAQATCYRAQTYKTTRAFVKKIGLDPLRYSISYQSRLAGEPWLTPYTDFEFKRLPHEGKKRLLVITPAFTADCLETLEEIRVEGKAMFLAAGGQSFTHIPCLNDQPAYINFLANRIRTWLATEPISIV